MIENKGHLASLAEYVRETLKNEPRSDALWRGAILTRQIGQWLGVMVSHNPELAPDARPMSGKLDASADLLVQTLYCLESLGMDLELVAAHAEQRMRAGVWKAWKRGDLPLIEGKPTGILAHSWKGNAPFIGTVHSGINLGSTRPKYDTKYILFLDHLDNDDVPKLQWWKKEVGDLLVVTQHGGMLSHAAIACREFDIPCVVGLGAELKSGDSVRFKVDLQTQRAYLEG